MSDTKKLGLFALIALVVSSSIGSGVFDLTASLAAAGTAGPAIIAWIVVAIGFLFLVLSINFIVKNKPEVDGLVDYAREGFGNFWGFVSGWGYWLSCWLGNIAFATVLMGAVAGILSTTGSSFLGDPANVMNWPAIIIASVVMWLIMILVNSGIKSASVVNAVVMVAKLVPLLVFLIIAIISFKAGVFTADFWGNVFSNAKSSAAGFSWSVVWPQVQSSFMVLLWVFVGIEGATVFTGRAQKRSEAAKATIIGFIGLVVIYVFISLLPFGMMPHEKLVALSSPVLGQILKTEVGNWGVVFINVGLSISILGAWISWTMLPVEAATTMADRKLLPNIFGKLNKKGSPTFTLILTTLLCQIFVVTLHFPKFMIAGSSAYDFAFGLCASAILVCWLFIGLYQMKLAIQKKKYAALLIGLVAAVFQILMMAWSGIAYLIIVLILYIPGVILYLYARSKQEGGIKVIDWIGSAVFFLAGIGLAIMIGVNYDGGMAFFERPVVSWGIIAVFVILSAIGVFMPRKQDKSLTE